MMKPAAAAVRLQSTLLKKKTTSSITSKISIYHHFSTLQEKFIIQGTMNFKSPQVGQYATVDHIFHQEDVNHFSELCGDNNPIHISPEIAQVSMFGGTIVHGIFTSSLFSTIFGRTLPGAIYVDQKLNFKRPVHVGKKVQAKVEVLEVKDRRKGVLLLCATTCSVEGQTAIDGTASVLLLNST